MLLLASLEARLCQKLSTNELCFKTGAENIQDSRWDAFKIYTGMEGFSLILFTAKNDSGLPSHLHGLKNSLFLKGFEAIPKLR